MSSRCPICVRCWTVSHRSRDGHIVPRTVFTKGGGLWLESLADSGADCVGLDWTVDIGERASAWVTKSRCRATSIRLFCSPTPEMVRSEAAKVLAGYGAGSGHVFNLGHGVSQFTPPDNVATLVDAVHELSRPYHQP